MAPNNHKGNIKSVQLMDHVLIPLPGSFSLALLSPPPLQLRSSLLFLFLLKLQPLQYQQLPFLQPLPGLSEPPLALQAGLLLATEPLPLCFDPLVPADNNDNQHFSGCFLLLLCLFRSPLALIDDSWDRSSSPTTMGAGETLIETGWMDGWIGLMVFKDREHF